MRLLPKHLRPFVFLFSVFFLLGTFLLVDGPGMFALDSVSAQGDDVLGVETFGETTALSGGGEGGIIGIVARIINIFLGLLGVIAVGLMIYAGVVWMSSAGDETKIATAKKILVNATIGLAIIMSSWAIASFILNKLGVASGVLEEEVGFGDGPDGGTFDCLGFCVSPGNERERCTEDIFVVKSLSPKTVDTGMNNVSVRAVFSQPLRAADKDRAITLLSSGPLVGDESTFDGTLPRQVVDVKTRAHHQSNNGEGWFPYCRDCFTGDGVHIIDRVDDVDQGVVTHLRFTRSAGLQKDTNLGLSAGQTYELQVVYKVEKGRLLVRVGDHDSDAAYENVSGALIDTNNQWRLFIKRFTYDPPVNDASLARIVLQGFTDANNVLSAFVGSVGIYPVEENGQVSPKAIELSHGNRVVTAHFSDLTDSCVHNNTSSCLSEGGYVVSVPEDLESVQGRPLQVRSDIPGCEDLAFPTSAGFAIADNSSVDLQDPTISPITFKKDGVEMSSHLLLENNAYTVHAEFADRLLNQGGVGLVTYTISGEGMQARTVQDGMSVADGSDGPYMVSSTLLFGALRGGDPDQYTITVSGFDIDNNPTSTEHVFNVQGASCDNGVLDEGEVHADEGGVCASNGACLVNADCRSGLCVDGECKTDKPMIVDVFPQTWSGAPRNVITVAGSGFGEEPGRVVFSYTDDAGNPANLIATEACAGFPSADLWTDEAAVVTVPIGLPQNSLSSIRIERADYKADEDEHNYKFDTSTDTHGPSRGNTNALGGSGYFLQNGEQSPGLCAITTLEDQNNVIEEALINTQVVALGENFGNNIGTLNFGAVPGAVTNWSNNKIQSRVPNMPRQQVYVFAASSDNKQSNALPLRIITEEIEDAPEITSVEGLPTSRNSLITIRGRHFGTGGRVFLADSVAAMTSCMSGNTVDCIELKVEGIEGCNQVSTWNDQQIIAEVVNVQDAGPIIAAGNYRIGVLRTSQGRQGSNTDKVIDVTNEGPKPSLCGVSPSSGPAPNGNIMLSGKNLDEEHTIYYFKKDANTDVEGARNHIGNGDFSSDVIFWSANNNASLSRAAVTETLNIQYVAGNNAFTLIQNDDITGLEVGATYRLSFTVGGLNVPTVQARFAEQDIVVTSGAGVFSGTVTLLMDQTEGKVSFAISNFNNGSFTLDDIRFTKETGLETWLSSAIHEYDNQPVSKQVNNSDTEMQTQIPEDENQYSMITGPIRVLSQDGSLSNGVTYAVENCLEDDAEVPDEMICCLEGEDAGMLRPVNALCAGEVREAGYVWRFNTGLIPVIPRVLEQCNDSIIARVKQEDGGEEPPARLTPSPSPSELLTRNQLACPNSDVIVLFNTPMNDINQEAVLVRDCGQGEQPECEDGEVLNNLPEFGLGHDLKTLYVARGGLAPSTWHEVVLDVAQITSMDRGIPLRFGGEENCPDNSYCFRFKTDNNECELTGAFVRPSQYTAEHFGVIQNPSFPRDEQRIDTPPNPYIFSVLGLTDKLCLTIDVGDRPWQWESDNVPSAEIARDDFNLDPDETAVKTTAPNDRVNITASLVGALPITSESLRLRIAPQTPRVIDYWPNCTQSCSNGTIGMVFNRRMLDLSVNNIRLQQCDSSVCENLVQNLQVSQIGNNSRETVDIRVRPQELLFAGKYYKVTVTGAQPVNGYNNNTPVPGQAMEDFSWIFRVRGENAIEAFCAPDSININPSVYIAREVGERNMYTALPFSVADECSREGQELDPFDYGWEWDSGAEVDGIVAEITTFSSPVSENRSCNNQCLKTGSDILRIPEVGMSNIPLCGNEEVDLGEDCDIGVPGEVPGTSCGFDCLRPGNTQDSCGNGEVDSELGEECDNDSAYCSDTCLNTGTEPLPAVMEEGRSYCGSGDVGPGEDCDGGAGCSISCLHEGTALSALWCEANNIRFPIPCQNAVTVCGNNSVEHNEECDDINDASCTDQCVYGDLSGLADPNDNEYYQDPATEGATRFATCAGSSLLYSTPSFCGDSDEGIGEDPDCETLVGGINPLGQNPVQLATAIGESEMNVDNEMSTAIEATALSYVDAEGNTQDVNILGSGEYTLQCGYTERNNPSDTSIIPITTQNNCPSNGENAKGVGSSTCCSDRPVIATHYPDQDADQVCLNTALHITFDEVIAEESITPNAFALLRGSNNECEDSEEVVDADDIARLALQLPVPAQEKKGFFTRTWQVITGFFRGLFFEDVLAIDPDLTWCKTATTLTPTPQYFFEDETLKTRIHLQMSEALEADTSYALYISGGVDGLKNSEGVGMRSKETRGDQFITSDIISFVTGDKICKVGSVSVDPADYTYNTPDTPNDFSINVKTSTVDNNGGQQEISPIDTVYNWTYRWGPRTSQIYAIPQDLSYDGLVGTVSSTAVEGSELLVGSIDITVDVSDASTVGDTFSGVSELTSFFCENPWPSRDGMPYNDQRYNFSFYYCADAGLSGERVDDLPFLEESPPLFNLPEDPGNQGLLYKVIFPSDKNEDAIGVQVFQNPNASSTRQWLDFYFPGTVDNMQPVSISGYGGFTNGHTYYVAARNMHNANTLYNNIYSFTINRDAQENTKQVFTQIIDTLELNSNLSNFNLCLADDVVYEEGDMFRLSQRENILVTDIGCSTDFECRDPYGNNLSGTNGVCFSARDKMARDIDRLASLKNLENSIERYKSERGQYPQIVGGTFVAQYTNSRWPSWNILSQMIGGAQIDPINAWTQCSRCNGGLYNGRQGDQIVQKYGNLCVLRVACGEDDSTDLCQSSVTDQNIFGLQDNELFTAVFSCAMQANSCGDAAWCYDVDPQVNTQCGLRNYESGDFLCAENQEGVLVWLKKVNTECNETNRCAVGLVCVDNVCKIDDSLSVYGQDCQANNECQSGHCATLLGGGEGLCVHRSQCIKTNGDGLVPINSGESADGQFMCDNGELIIDQNSNQISDAKEKDYQGAAACQSDIQCPGALNSCEDLDQQTCWDAANTTVHCPALSQMFEYESLGANAYKIHAPLEFFSEDQAINTPNAAGDVGFDLSESFETALWCAQPRGGAGGPICGDGIVSGDEECDIASYERVTDTFGCQVVGEVQTKYCSNECREETTDCDVSATCGDGVVDAGEDCDDGVNNGRYGSTCSTTCQILDSSHDDYAGYCGDGELQTEHEFCDISEGQCRFSYQEEGVIKPNIFFVIDHSGSLDQDELVQVAGFASGVNGTVGFASLYYDKVQIGAIRFPNILNMGCGSDESNYNPVGEYNEGQISSMFTLTQNGQNLTPTPSVMQDVRLFGLYEDASDPLNDLRGKKVILITDGDPTCDIPGDDCTNDPVCVSVQNSEGYADAAAKERRVRHTVAQIEALSALGVETYIVGFSSGAQDEYLQRFANAGGTDTVYVADDAEGLLSSVEEIIGCTDYSLRAGNSCSADCQDFGGYCGDGIIQRSEGEQCDDGNYISDDGCNIYCKTGAVAEQPQDINGTCGDGVVQNPNNDGEEEVCDLGDQNGIACDPEYGESCTYCSHDCRENLTVDPIAQCGDGKIDFMREGTAGEYVRTISGSDVDFDRISGFNSETSIRKYEVCDQSPVQDSLVAHDWFLPIIPTLSQEERFRTIRDSLLPVQSYDDPVLGSSPYSCENFYKDFWGVYGQDDPRVAVGELACSNTCDALTIGCHICGDVTEPLPPYTDNERAVAKVKVHNVLGESPQWYGALSPSFVFSKKEGEPISFFSAQDQQEQRLFSFGRLSMRNNSPVLEPLYIGSSLQCNRTLYIPTGIRGFGIFKPMYGVQFNNLGHIFEFPVNNERDEVENEIFVSPAVPPDTFRAVVRFYKTDPTVYAGNVFSDEYQGLDSGLLVYNSPQTPKCVMLGRDGDESYYEPLFALGFPCLAVEGETESAVTVHQPFREVGVDLPAFQDYAQATTITSPPAAGEPFAFFVDSYAENNLINGDVVRSGVNNNVTVELYRHHEGQNPEFSLYKPDYVFRMNLAEGSNNRGARYWHVFNLVHNSDTEEYEVQEANRDGQVITTDNTTQYTSHNGSIETDYVDVLCNVPEQACR